MVLNKIKTRARMLTTYFKRYRTSQRHRKNDAGKPVVFMNLKDVRMEPYYYALVHFFHQGGYQIELKNNFWFIGHSFGPFQNVFELSSVHIKNKPSVPEQSVYIYDERAGLLSGHQWQKVITLDYNVYEPDRSAPSIHFPFPMHPNTYHLKRHEQLTFYREQTRRLKLFFSGNVHRDSYSHKVFKEYFNMLTRTEIIDTLKEHLSTHEVQLIEKEEDFPKAGYQNKCVLNDWVWSPDYSEKLHLRRATEQWLEALASSDFFLACSGIRMPHSHNVIEAMSVGTIPLIEYDELFTPSLEHMKNCIAFRGKKDLLEKVRMVLSMNEEQVLELRKNVIEYYEQHLSAQSFCYTLNNSEFEKINLLLNAESVSVSCVFPDL